MFSATRRYLARKTSLFGKDQSGAIILMFGLFASVLLSLAAGAVEIHRRNSAVQQLQNAVDAAALAGKRRQTQAQQTLPLAASRAQGSVAALAMFNRTISGNPLLPTAVIPTITWLADGSIKVEAAPEYKTVFTNVLPASFKQVNVRAIANYANSVPTEVAMVLDTTMSMFAQDGRPDTRFTLMRNAAKKFTHDLFNAAQAQGDANLVRISVVPWATSVNVRGAAPAAANFTGDAPVVSIPDWGSRIPVASPLARGMVANTGGTDFQPVTWRGCISGNLENPTSYTDAAQSNWNALIIRPASIDVFTFYEGPLTPITQNSCTCTATTLVPCGVTPGTQGFNQLIERAIPKIKNAAFLFDKGVEQGGSPDVQRAQAMCTSCTTTSCVPVTVMQADCSVPTATYTRRYCGHADPRRNNYYPNSFSCTSEWYGCKENGRNITEAETRPACVADPNEPGIINNTVTWCPQYSLNAKIWNQPQGISGPNMNCPSPMLGLSGSRAQVLEYIDRMHPVPGGTHADVGLRWGLRTLAASNGWPSFFGVTRAPAAWGAAAQKVMVMITDGENEQAVDFAGYWGCSYNDAKHDCTTSPDAAELDTRMQGWCNAIRTNYQVTIYAIAVNFTNTAAVTKLQNCAGSNANVFSVDAADLNNVLAGIAARVMAMRLTQ